MKTAKIISVEIQRTDNGLFRATSDDVLGLHAVASDVDSLRQQVCSMLVDLYAARGEMVEAYEAETRDSQVPPPWVVVPKDSKALAC